VCTIDYRYDWGWFGGDGHASAGGTRQSLTTRVRLPRPPAKADATVTSCDSNVDLTHLSFSGGILSKIANLFKSLFRGKLEDVLQGVLCDELGTLGSDLLTSLTSGMHEAIFEYVPPAKGGTYAAPLRSADPLQRERGLDAAYQSSLVSWSDLLRPDAAAHPDNTVGHPDADPIALMGIVPQAFAAADAYLGERRPDKSATTASAEEDLGINCLLREQGIVDPATGLIEIDFTNATHPEGMVFYDGDDPLTHTKIGVRKVSVQGLDKFATFAPLKVLGHQSFSHAFSLPGKVTLKLEAYVSIGPSRLKDSLVAQHQGNTVEENPQLTVSFSNLDVDAATFLSVSRDRVLHLRLGSVIDNPVECVASTVDDLEISKFLATIADVDEPQFSGFLSSGIDRLFSQATHIAFLMYEETMLAAMPGMVESSAVDAVNTMVREYLTDNSLDQRSASHRTCPAPRWKHGSQVYVNFSNSTLWRQIEDFALEPLSGQDPQTVNEMVAGLSPDGAWKDPLGLVKVEAGTGEAMLGVITVKISNSSLANLDTIYGLEVLAAEPYRYGETWPNNTIAGVTFDGALREDDKVSSPYTLSTSMGIGKRDRPLNFSLRLMFAASGGTTSAGGASAFHNDFTFSLEIAEAEVLLQTLTQIDLGSLQNLKMLHWTHPDCWISALERFGLARARALVGGWVHAKVKCHSCSSPGFRGLEQTMATLDARQEMTEFVNGFFNRTAEFLEGDRLQQEMDAWVRAATDRCTNATGGHRPDGTRVGYGEPAVLVADPNDGSSHRPSLSSSDGSFDWASFDYTLFALIGALIGLVAVCVHFCVRERAYQQMLLKREREIEDSKKRAYAEGMRQGRTGSSKPRSAMRRSVRWSVGDAVDAQGHRFRDTSGEIQEKTTTTLKRTALKTTTITTTTITQPNPGQSPLIAASKSLFRSPTVPCLIRYLVPLALLGNAMLFLSGHLSLGAQVRVKAHVAGELIVLPQVFEFSLAQSTIDMWSSGGKLLAVILVIFSGLWPYAKVSISMFLWFAPPETYAPSSRGAAFMWLDALGKWSMIDIFVLVLSMVGFHITILSPQLAMLPDEFYDFEIMVIPVWGLYANLIAQIVSQVVSHIAIYYHRNVVAQAEIVTGFKLLSNKNAKKKPQESSVDSALTGTGEGVDLTNTSTARASDLDQTMTNPMHDAKKKKTTTTKPPAGHMMRPTVTDYSQYGNKTQKEINRAKPAVRAQSSRADASAVEIRGHNGMVSSRIAHWEKPAAGRSRATTWVSSTDCVTGPRKALANRKAPLRAHVYEMAAGAAPGSGLRLRVQISPCGQLAVVIFICATCAVLLYGSAIVSFYMHTSGLAGIAIEIGREGASMERFSIFSVIENIAAQADADMASTVGIFSIAGIFMLCAVIVPGLQLLGLVFIWMVPLSLKNQKRTFLVMEAISAWSYLEVYIIAVSVAVLQMGQISAEMAKPICGDLEPTFKLLTDMGLLEEVNANCFTVNSGIEMGTYVLLVGVVWLNVLTQLVFRCATAAMQDREARLRGDLNPWSAEERPMSFFRNKLVYFLWFCCCCLRYVGEPGDEDDMIEQEDEQEDAFDTTNSAVDGSGGGGSAQLGSAAVEAETQRLSALSSSTHRSRSHSPRSGRRRTRSRARSNRSRSRGLSGIWGRRRGSTAVYVPRGKGDLPPVSVSWRNNGWHLLIVVVLLRFVCLRWICRLTFLCFLLVSSFFNGTALGKHHDG
jgi:hypothetical protein